MRRWFLVLLLLAILGGTGGGAYWLLNRDQAPEVEVQDGLVNRFAMDGVPFTFLYPDRFAITDPPAGTRWIAGIGPSDAIDVRRIRPDAPAIDQVERIIRSSLKKLPAVSIVANERITVGGIPGVVFVIDSATQSQILRSRLVYFTAGGATWQIGCQAQQSAQIEIDAACGQVLGSLAFR